MKFISFEIDGRASCGILQGDSVHDLSGAFSGQALDLKTLIARELLSEAMAYARSHEATLRLADIKLLPVIPNPEKIICVGLNYGEHVRETGRDVTERPTLFMRVASSQLAHGEALARPIESVKLDYEGEIALIIGRGGRRIAASDAWSHIAGYACYNDGSIRDWQTATSQWTAGKNFWRTGAFGPWMTSADEIVPGRVMTLVTRLNGREMQRTTTDKMIHDIPSQIAYISTFLPLAPGDVIVTGTPGGVGAKRNPPVFMKHGDVVEIEVDAIGVLRNTVCDESLMAEA